MTIDLTDDRRQFIADLLKTGHYDSETEVVDEALELLKRRKLKDRAETLEAVREGFEDLKAGRHKPLEEAMEEIRRDFHLSPDE